MAHPLTVRIGTAGAAFVFVVTGALTGSGLCPRSHHGSHSVDAIAMEADHADRRAKAGGNPSPHGAGPRSAAQGHPSGHTQQGSSQECTCIGACAGGAAHSLPRLVLLAIWGGEIDRRPVVRPAALRIRQSPNSYLFPLPNAPPGRA